MALAFTTATAQDSSRIFVNTGFAAVKVTGKLNKVLKPTVDFTSGIEAVLPGNWFAQGTLDMNRLKYQQQETDEKSPYLFQNTSADLFMIGLSGGKHFDITKGFSLSGYLGGGYVTLSEPRILLKDNVALQDDVRRRAGFGRLGAKLSVQTGIKLLQTIYLDASKWKTPLTIQGYPLHGLSFIVGAKMQM